MPNPPPFAPVAYDNPDWVSSTQLVNVTGTTPTPYQASGGSSANFAHSNTAAVVNPTTSFNLGIQPTDGLTHRLTSASMTFTVGVLTVTGVAVASFQLTDHAGTTTYLDLEMYINGLPSSDQLPNRTVSLAWPGGVPITVQANGTSQLQLVMQMNPAFGGTVTTWNVEGSICYTWS